jgi:hypothetical protein
MAQKAEYKVITGTTNDVEREIVVHALKGWKPILMSTVSATKGIMVTVILEYVVGS